MINEIHCASFNLLNYAVCAKIGWLINEGKAGIGVLPGKDDVITDDFKETYTKRFL